MLYKIEDDYYDVVRERPYKDLLTVRASSKKQLKRFADSTLGEIVQVPHHIYTHMVHVPLPVLETTFDWKDLRHVEVLDRLTPEPVAFAYEYAEEDEDGKVWGEYGFCWPDEIESTTDSLFSSEKNILGDPAFMPLFYIPSELVGAPIKFDLEEGEN